MLVFTFVLVIFSKHSPICKSVDKIWDVVMKSCYFHRCSKFNGSAHGRTGPNRDGFSVGLIEINRRWDGTKKQKIENRKK